MTESRFTYAVVASELHDAAVVDSITAGHRALLEETGGHRGGPDDIANAPFLILVATGGTERRILHLLEERSRVAREPALLVAHPLHNSLPACLETLARIRQDGGTGRILYLPDPSSEQDRATVSDAIVDVTAVHRFRQARIGLVGGASDWLVASSPSPAAVRQAWGPTVVTIPTEEVLAGYGSAPEVDTERLTTDITSVTGVSTVTVSEIRKAARLEPALHKVVYDRTLDAVAVRCFDLLSEPGTSGCVALAALNDERIVAGCEGDLNSTLAMMWVRYLYDTSSWIANPARLDPATDTVTLAHCTIAPSLVTEVELTTHFESGIGVGIRGHLPEADVTLIRIGGSRLERLWLAEGHITHNGHSEHLCRTQVDVSLPPGTVEDILERPLGNHVVLMPGHHARRLRRWWNMAVNR